ncbi:MAG: general L-amino acid transport system permease protein [Glaciecola sp.]|jgi:general L-amino acid transport system permease protein
MGGEITYQTPPEAPLGDPHKDASSRSTWAKENLFATARDTIISIVMGSALLAVMFITARFVLVTARWEVIYRNVTNLLVGAFPRDDLNLVWIMLFLVVVGIGLMIGAAHTLVAQADDDDILESPQSEQVVSAARRFAPLILFVLTLLMMAREARFAALGMILAIGVFGWSARTFGLKVRRERANLAVGAGALLLVGAFIFLAANVGWDDWGGLLLTVFLAGSAIVLCFPFGVLAALGRRSDLPVMRMFSVGYIELIRGVPLITLLLVGSLMLRFFLPENLAPSAVSRAIIMITLFSGAYVAEIVRGGLQAVHPGQSEAARALGLPKTKEMRLIVLPQALRNVIPALVGQFISLFKDTSLVVIIGLRELLGVTQNFTKQPEFNGTGVEAEVLVLAAFVYWVIAFTMSRESQRLETRLGVGTR